MVLCRSFKISVIGSKSSLRDSGFSNNTVTMARTWPLPSADVKEEDDDPDECQACQGSHCSQSLAWNAYYVEGYNLRDSKCIGGRCVDMIEKEEDDDEEKSKVDKEEQLPTSQLDQQSHGWSHIP